MSFTDYAKAFGELGREDREKMLTKARYDGSLTVTDYIKLEQLDQALCSIEDNKRGGQHHAH